MILSGQTIRKKGIFTPFRERTKRNGMSYGLSMAGYDVRVNFATAPIVTLRPGDFMLAVTCEHFDMPPDVLGIVHDKSTWARQGIAVQNTVIEPGWKGYLTLEITNHGTSTVVIQSGDPIAQIVCHLLDEPAEKLYDGKYQDQEDTPQAARFEH
jgi:dCTP deaminase